MFLFPVLGGHFAAIEVEPHDVLDVRAGDAASLEKMLAAEYRMLLAQGDEMANIVKEPLPILIQMPVEPAQFVVLAIGIVVALLGSADFIAGEQHRHALRQQQGGQQIAFLAPAQRVHLGIVGRALDAAVPAQVVVVAVAVVLAVGLVVFLVVADEIVEREAVVGGDEVDAGVGASSRALV